MYMDYFETQAEYEFFRERILDYFGVSEWRDVEYDDLLNLFDLLHEPEKKTSRGNSHTCLPNGNGGWILTNMENKNIIEINDYSTIDKFEQSTFILICDHTPM